MMMYLYPSRWMVIEDGVLRGEVKFYGRNNDNDSVYVVLATEDTEEAQSLEHLCFTTESQKRGVFSRLPDLYQLQTAY